MKKLLAGVLSVLLSASMIIPSYGYESEIIIDELDIIEEVNDTDTIIITEEADIIEEIIEEDVVEVESSSDEEESLMDDITEKNILDTPDESTTSIVDSGECGEELIWSLTDEGTLTISGTDKMSDFGYEYSTDVTTAPWGKYYSNIKKVIICQDVTSIGERAFYGCRSLESITIPNSVTSIGFNAFSRCTSLESITIPTSVTSIGDWAFSRCTSLESITIPTSVTSIGDGTFNGCTSLESITIPTSVTSIGDGTFNGCTSLESITIPNSVTSIGESAFCDCTSLESITIPNSVTSIGDGAFSGCTGLESIEIPNSVTSIGESAFAYHTNLKSINVDPDNLAYDSRNNCQAIIERSSNELIVGCINTVVPYSVTSIGDWAFSGCTGLKSIEIPTSVTSIGDSAFSRCTGLKSIEIPTSVTSIGDSAFSRCTGLKSIEIPTSVTSIGDLAFSGCTGLKGIEIPTSVTSIGDGTFNECTSLESITIPNSVTSIGEGAFYGCTNLSNIEMSSAVKIIGDWAFSDCESLESIVIPSGVWRMRGGAFRGCLNLKKVQNNSSVILPLLPIVEGKYWINTSTGEVITSIANGTAIRNDYVEETPDTYTVTFNPNGGSFATDGFDGVYHGIEEGAKIPAPLDNPTRNGYTFEGWYKDQACTQAWNFDVDSVTSDVTLYAKWTALNNNPTPAPEQPTPTPEEPTPTPTPEEPTPTPTPVPEKVTQFKNNTIRINVGNKVSCDFENNTGKKVTYKSSNTKVVTVDSKGKLAAKGKGKATVSAKVNGKTYKCTVYVYNPKIDGRSEVKKGKSITLKVKDGYGKTTWSTSNKKIATVDKSGKVKGKKKGKVTITAINNGKKITKKITVK